MSDFIPYVRHSIDQDDINSVVEALKSDFITQGPIVDEYEKKVATYAQANHAVAVANGTAALHIACLAAGFKEGDVVITSPLTFVASSNSVLYTGAEVAFTDVDDFGCMCPESLEFTIQRLLDQGKCPKGIIPVHLSGNVCDMPAISKVARNFDLIVIEDASHAFGTQTTYGPCGNCKHSQMVIYSTHPAKNITTGEGGLVLTNDQSLFDRLNLFRSHGITKNRDLFYELNPGSWHYEQQVLGFNYRIADFQCALGISQLKKLDQFIRIKREKVAYYNEKLQSLDVHPLGEREGIKSAYHLYLLGINSINTLKDKIAFYKKMIDKGIGINMHYIPVYRQPFYKKMLNLNPRDFPMSEKYFIKYASFPLYTGLSKESQDRVIKTLRDVLGQ